MIIRRYSDENGNMDFDNYIGCLVRLDAMCRKFHATVEIFKLFSCLEVVRMSYSKVLYLTQVPSRPSIKITMEL